MYIIRPIQLSDYQTYVELAFSAKLGMLSMPKNPEILKQNIHNSLKAFSLEASSINNEFYLFVLENIETKQIGGVCGIYATIGVDCPHYYYRLEPIDLEPHNSLPITKQLSLLKPISLSKGISEICSLFLMDNFRKEGLGKFLSLSRFLFIANFPNRFEDEIIAEMRGFVNENNSNDFWDHVGKNFLNMSYTELIQTENLGLDFVKYVIPQYPLYLELLPKEAQEAVGKIHKNTLPALKILQNEGFEPSNLYDIFDVGPVMISKKNKIRTIIDSQQAVMEGVTVLKIDSPLYIISNDKLDFRACMTPLQFITPYKATFPINVAKELNLHPGDSFRYILQR